MKVPANIKAISAVLILATAVSCKDGNSNDGSQSYKDNHPKDSQQSAKGDSARVEDNSADTISGSQE